MNCFFDFLVLLFTFFDLLGTESFVNLSAVFWQILGILGVNDGHKGLLAKVSSAKAQFRQDF